MKTSPVRAILFGAACVLTLPALAEPVMDALDAAKASARDQVAQAKPNQQAALRYLAYSGLAQYYALLATPEAGPAAQAGALRTATQSVAAALMGGEAPKLDEPGAAAGEAAARRVLARAAVDGFAQASQTEATTPADGWRSQLTPPKPPHLPSLGRMRTVYLARGDELRPPAPPARGSAEFERDLDEVRRLSAAPGADGLASAKFWEMTSGSLVAGYWDEQAMQLARQSGVGALQAALAGASAMLAALDANIACHDAKYTYWVARPSQVDPAIRPVLGLPNHPSYPSNHACDSGAAAGVLGQFYPAQAAELSKRAEAAAESRYFGGLHYRFDGTAGLAIGRGVAQRVQQRGPRWLADLPLP